MFRDREMVGANPVLRFSPRPPHRTILETPAKDIAQQYLDNTGKQTLFLTDVAKAIGIGTRDFSALKPIVAQMGKAGTRIPLSQEEFVVACTNAKSQLIERKVYFLTDIVRSLGVGKNQIAKVREIAQSKYGLAGNNIQLDEEQYQAIREEATVFLGPVIEMVRIQKQRKIEKNIKHVSQAAWSYERPKIKLLSKGQEKSKKD